MLCTVGGITAVPFIASTDGIAAPASQGIASVAPSQNFWWDFAQTNTFTGQTQFGRGGGTSAPCGYWVFYALE